MFVCATMCVCLLPSPSRHSFTPYATDGYVPISTVNTPFEIRIFKIDRYVIRTRVTSTPTKRNAGHTFELEDYEKAEGEKAILIIED